MVTPKRRLSDVERVSRKLLRWHQKLGSWPKVAARFDVTPAMAWRVAKQKYEPKDDVIRDKLGFDEIITQKVRRDKLGRFS